jgi:diphthamide synthase (EF-2-diphthine--ammonia ligase)
MEKGIVLWSGGKDCTIALHKARLAGIKVTHLVPIMYDMPELNRNTYSIHSSGLSKEILQQQADSLECTLVPYELPNIFDFTMNGFIEFLKPIVVENNLTQLITGEGGNPSMALWLTQTASEVGLSAMMPNTHSNENCLNEARYIIDTGYKCKIVSVDDIYYDNSILSREYNYDLISKFQDIPHKSGILTNPVSAGNEYHTIAYDGPEFKYPIKLGNFEIKTVTTHFHDDNLNKTTNLIHYMLFR